MRRRTHLALVVARTVLFLERPLAYQRTESLVSHLCQSWQQLLVGWECPQTLYHQVPCKEVGQTEPEDARRHVGWPQLRHEQLLTTDGAVGWWATEKTWWNQFFCLMVRHIFWFHQVLFMVQTNLAVQLSTVEEIFGLNVFGELCE